MEGICTAFETGIYLFWNDLGIVSVEQFPLAVSYDRFRREETLVLRPCDVCHVL